MVARVLLPNPLGLPLLEEHRSRERRPALGRLRLREFEALLELERRLVLERRDGHSADAEALLADGAVIQLGRLAQRGHDPSYALVAANLLVVQLRAHTIARLRDGAVALAAAQLTRLAEVVARGDRIVLRSDKAVAVTVKRLVGPHRRRTRLARSADRVGKREGDVQSRGIFTLCRLSMPRVTRAGCVLISKPKTSRCGGAWFGWLSRICWKSAFMKESIASAGAKERGELGDICDMPRPLSYISLFDMVVLRKELAEGVGDGGSPMDVPDVTCDFCNDVSELFFVYLVTDI